MRVKMKIRRDDEVLVISGKDKGVKGKVVRVIPKLNQVVVEGVNIVRRHMRPSPAHPEGGVIPVTKPIHASNVQIVDPTSGKPTKVGFKVVDGKKTRFAKASGALLG